MQPSLFDIPNAEQPSTPVAPAWTLYPPSVLSYLQHTSYTRLRVLLSNLELPALLELDRAVTDEVLNRYKPVKKRRVRRKKNV